MTPQEIMFICRDCYTEEYKDLTHFSIDVSSYGSCELCNNVGDCCDAKIKDKSQF